MIFGTISLRKLLGIVLLAAVLIFIGKSLGTSRSQSSATCGSLTSPDELPAMELSSYKTSAMPHASIVFIVIQSNSTFSFHRAPGRYGWKSVIFRDKIWYLSENQFKLVIIIDDQLKFSDVVDEPWIKKNLGPETYLTAEDVWKIVDHLGAR